jgi:sugar/nucleoside kinase (ribokinase family)
MEKKTSIIGIGNALTDIIIKLDNDNQLSELGLEKGSMLLIDSEKAKSILNYFKDYPKEIISGGSNANTMHGLAHLGANVGYIGKIGEDIYGEHYIADLKRSGINPRMYYSKFTTSGIAITLMSPDSERTFATYLGAALELNAEELNPNYFQGFDILHIEGYLVQNHDLVRQAIKLAKHEGLKISSDLPGFNVIREDLDFIMEMLESLDIVFANEEEAKATTGLTSEQSLDFFAKYCEYAFVKLGSKGSIAKHNNETAIIEVGKSNCIDSNGAGDAYAAGALYGISNGYPLAIAGKIGSLVAENVIQVVGTKLSAEKWNAINADVKNLVK